MQISSSNRSDDSAVQNTGFLSRILTYFTRFLSCTRLNVVIDNGIDDADQLSVPNVQSTQRESDQDFALRILQQLKNSQMPSQ